MRFFIKETMGLPDKQKKELYMPEQYRSADTETNPSKGVAIGSNHFESDVELAIEMQESGTPEDQAESTDSIAKQQEIYVELEQ